MVRMIKITRQILTSNEPIDIDREEKEWIIFWGDSRLVKIDIKYVHELQNLYFALTGQELIIKN